MKKLIVLSLAISTLLVSCDIRKQLEKKENANKPTEAPEFAAAKKLVGAYTGNLGKNKITLLITSAGKDTIYGCSVLATTKNPFVGIIKLGNGVISVKETEGKFNFSMNEKRLDSLVGKWLPDPISKDTTAISYTLIRKKLQYKKDVGIYPFTTSRVITETDLSNLSNWEITLMKGEILARHGMVFSENSLKDAFETKEWYVPVSDDVTASLTDIEKKNLEMIDQHK